MIMYINCCNILFQFLKDIHRQKKTENRTLNTDLATLIDWFQKAGLSLDQALTIAKQVSTSILYN